MTDRDNRGKRDVFAEIGASRQAYRDSTLVTPQPPVLPDIHLPVRDGDADRFEPTAKMSTSADLRRELMRQRRLHAPFLKNLAPECQVTRERVYIEEFNWRIQTDADKRDFQGVLAGTGEWECVHIPHFGEPLGRATTYYRTTFAVNETLRVYGALYVCFKGVDYKAHVFVNGTFVGSHEGFFAPFEFDFTDHAVTGENTLMVVVENDAIMLSNDSWGEDGGLYEGDKVYAATGPGYDEPEIGWHHCPPGMGIYQDVYVEARPAIFISDVFVRPIPGENRAEAWIEVTSRHTLSREIGVELSVFGRNFRKTVVKRQACDIPNPAGPGVNYYRISVEMPNHRLWWPESPWLYQMHVRVTDVFTGQVDEVDRQFGMRTFVLDENSVPKGRMYLNGREIRLRGANTMGHEQQCVMKRDWQQLIDDVLLAKICNMNFWRLTQRPVHSEIYEICDRLGLMTQTDLPLFGVVRRNQWAECVRQAEEMERLVRSHPCNIMVTYINEPFPAAQGKPHRNMLRDEMESMFEAASHAVRLSNPDRVIKPVDGDYDPPAEGLPDNHCYCGWYNGHGVQIGMLHKGYWQPVKPGWMYGCGEFGSEGLDPVELMRRRYPAHWLPQSRAEEKTWSPDRITKSQNGRFHYMWYETPKTLKGWVESSQTHQAWVTRLMTEAFRRNKDMVTFAIHLFIDAFPSGWMKTIMDVERQPKKAFFVYRDALTPLMVSLRSDRLAYFAGEKITVEAWVCNDLETVPDSTSLRYQLVIDGRTIQSGMTKAKVEPMTPTFQGYLDFSAPAVSDRCEAEVQLALTAEDGSVLHHTSLSVSLFPALATAKSKTVRVYGTSDGPAARLAADLGCEIVFGGTSTADETILMDDISASSIPEWGALADSVRGGASLILLCILPGTHKVFGSKVVVSECGMGERNFVNCGTGHPIVSDFLTNDFKFWFDPRCDYATPMLSTVFQASGFRPILTSGNGDWQGDWGPALAAAEKRVGQGSVRICQVELAGRIERNPVAQVFARRLLALD